LNHDDPRSAIRQGDAAAVKARNASLAATAPTAFLAASKRLWIEIVIAPAASGLLEPSVRAPCASIWRTSVRAADIPGGIDGLEHHGVVYGTLPDGSHIALPLERAKAIPAALVELCHPESLSPAGASISRRTWSPSRRDRSRHPPALAGRRHRRL
jgi:hypothetical protein